MLDDARTAAAAEQRLTIQDGWLLFVNGSAFMIVSLKNAKNLLLSQQILRIFEITLASNSTKRANRRGRPNP